MRVHIVDPSAFTPPYDHALASALAHAGVDVELITSRFGYGSVPEPDGYAVREAFYRHAVGGVRGAGRGRVGCGWAGCGWAGCGWAGCGWAGCGWAGPGSKARLAAKLVEHVPDMLRYRSAARAADVVHFQWLPVQAIDRHLLPDRPTVLTAHDLLPREPRPGQVRAQRRLYDAVDAIVVHSEYGRNALVNGLNVDPARVRVIHHGAFKHLTAQAHEEPLPPELRAVEVPVVLFFGLLRPYKGLETLLAAWRGVAGAELWVVGRPRMPLAPIQALAPEGARFVPRFVSDAELPALFRRADIVVLPYARTERLDWSGVLATALAFGKPTVVSDVGGFGELAAAGAARLVAPDDPAALHAAILDLLADQQAREGLAWGALTAGKGAYSWETAARETLALYRDLVP